MDNQPACHIACFRGVFIQLAFGQLRPLLFFENYLGDARRKFFKGRKFQIAKGKEPVVKCLIETG